MKPGGCSENSVANEFLVFEESSFGAGDFGLQKYESAIDVALVEHFFNEVHDFIDGEFVDAKFFGLFGLEDCGVLEGEEVVGGHFECE